MSNSVPDICPSSGKPKPPSVHDLDIYHENGKGYLVRSGNDYIVMSASDLKRHLLRLGFSGRRRFPQSEVEEALNEVQMHKSVAYSGPLAGYKAGVWEMAGKKILVTGGPKIVEPDPSVEWPTIRALIEQMLCPDEGRQLRYFYGWLSHAYRCLRKGEIAPGQALALAGPRQCGKTLAQQIIREVLGGREASPYAFMTGTSDFNRELFGAENLIFGDEVAATDYRARMKFGAMLKQLVVNPTQRCHGKGREAIALAPFWRLTMSLNDESANLEVLPPLSHDSIVDKIILLQAVRPPILGQDDWCSRSRSENWARIQGELPGFCAFLDQYQIPAELRDGRFGITHYQNPDLLVQLKAETPERRLLELIDQVELYWDPAAPSSRDGWECTAAMLEQRLENSDSAKMTARKLLHYQTACGQYLAQLAVCHPDRVRKEKHRNGLQQYRILPPSKS
ncbi:MAG: DUF5906 domain-containing protein [Opitutaceae bacterium]|jgi:hypothetical protein